MNAVIQAAMHSGIMSAQVTVNAAIRSHQGPDAMSSDALNSAAMYIQTGTAEDAMTGEGTMTDEITVKILRKASTVEIPKYATPNSAGVDLCSMMYGIIKPGEQMLVPTGIKLAIPEGYEAQIRPRSGLALTHHIIIPNSPGTIDSDYRGEIMVLLLNMGTEPFTITFGDRIAQMVFVPVVRAKFEDVKVLDDTKRGSGGFGSTGRR